MIVLGILVCSSFLISVCMLIVSKDVLISNATVIVRTGEAIWLTPLLRCCLLCVVPSLYSVMFCTRLAWVYFVCILLCKEEDSSPVSLQLLGGGIWVCIRYHCLCLCSVLDEDYVSQLPFV